LAGFWRAFAISGGRVETPKLPSLGKPLTATLVQKTDFADKDNSRTTTTLTGVIKKEEKLHLFNPRHLFDHCDQLLAPIIVPPPHSLQWRSVDICRS